MISMLKIYETTSDIVVERPDAVGKPYKHKEPLLKDPSIKVDTFIDRDNKVISKRIYYPKNQFTKEYIESNKDIILDRMEHCKLCERQQQEYLMRLQSAIDEHEKRYEQPSPPQSPSPYPSPLPRTVSQPSLQPMKAPEPGLGARFTIQDVKHKIHDMFGVESPQREQPEPSEPKSRVEKWRKNRIRVFDYFALD